MAWQFPPFALLTGLSAVVSLAVGWVVYTKRDTRGAQPLVVIFAGATIWAASSTLQLVSTDLDAMVFWANVRFIGIVLVPAGWLVFAIEYTGHGDWVSRPRLGLLGIEPIAVLVMILTNRQLGLFRSNTQLQSSGPFSYLQSTYEIGFWIHSAYSYLLLGLGTLLIVLLLFRTNDLYRSQVGALVLGVLVPWGANAAVLIGPIPPGVHPTPIAFIVSGIALTWAVFRHEFLDTIPMTPGQTQSTLIEAIEDATIVVDRNHRVIEANRTAKALLDLAKTDPSGHTLSVVFPELADLLTDSTPTNSRRVSFERTGSTRYFDTQITPVDTFHGMPAGYLIVLRDVTDRERHRQRLEVLNRVLRHDLRNEMNLLLGYADDLLRTPDASEEYATKIKEKGFEITALSQRARQLEQTLSEEEIVLERIDISKELTMNIDTLSENHPAVTIETHVPDGILVYANKLIGTAFENLLENAIEHNDQPTQSVRVTVTEPTGESDLVTITITDNGPGIPENERVVLEKGTETQLEHSSGLGLWLVNWIVTESGGEIEFRENDPQGTITTIRLLTAPPVTDPDP